MISTKGLQVGNWLQCMREGELVYFQLTGYDLVTIQKGYVPHWQYVPLTQAILEKAGFILCDDLGDMKYYQIPGEKNGYGVCFDHEELEFYQFQVGVSGDFDCYVPLIFDDPIFQNVHQLQNLYYALTGKEIALQL